MSEEEAEFGDQSGPRELREYAERQRAEAEEAKAALAEFQRKDHFRDAGLDPNNALHAAIMAGYTGALEGQAVKAFVEQTGVFANQAAPETATDPEPSDDEVAQHQRLAAATNGSNISVAPDVEADVNQQLADMVAQADRESWLPDRFNAAYAALVAKKGNPVAIGGQLLEP